MSTKVLEREQMKFFDKPAVKEYKSFVSRNLHVLSRFVFKYKLFKEEINRLSQLCDLIGQSRDRQFVSNLWLDRSIFKVF